MTAYAAFVKGKIDLYTVRSTPEQALTAARLWNPRTPFKVEKVRLGRLEAPRKAQDQS